MQLTSRLLPYRFVKINEIDRLKKTVEDLESQITTARNFIKQIEGGDLSADFGTLASQENENALSASLLSMRDQMRKISDDEKQRNWATQGLAKFVEILRSNNDNLKELGYVIISNIVKYTQSNQGAIYLVNDENPQDVHLQMIACYAYDRKKYIDAKIALGEGLVGQSVLEKASIYMTNLPESYLKITSGLGEALPKNLLIVPLTINGKVYGVIEMASFTTFEKHHKDFVEKLAESIASTISNVRVNEQTKKLLYETQTQAEQVRAQEEEMRQNLEELSATQEEMQRILREVENKEKYLNQLLNVSTDSIFTVDREFKLVSWNAGFAKTLEQFGMQLAKGVNTLDWYPGDERQKQIEIYSRAFNGESFDFTASSMQNGHTYYHLSIYAPLKKENGEVYEVACFAKDVTQMVNAQKNAENLRQEAQSQAEEVKAQEEELRQNMEELSATQEEMQRVMKQVQLKEAYVTKLLNVSTDSIFTIDKQYKLVSWNSAFAATLEKFGMKLAKGMNTIEWYPEAERAKFVETYERVLKGESFELVATTEQDGSNYYHLSVYAPLINDEGEVFEAAVFAKDITAMTNAQQQAEKLAENARIKENYLSALIDSSKDSIFTMDKEFKVISFNKAFGDSIRAMGIALEIGFNMLDIFTNKKEKEEQKALYLRAFKGETFEVTSQFEFDSVVSYYNSSFSPLRDEKGNVYAIAVFGRDVTEVRQTMEYTTELLNASEDMIYTIDKDFKLKTWNKTFELSLVKYDAKAEKGFNTLEWYPEGKQRQEQVALYKRVLKGESVEATFDSDANGQTFTFKTTYKPLKNKHGQVYEIALFTRDVTATTKSSGKK